MLLLALLACSSLVQAAAEFEARTWTDRLGRQLTSTFVDAKNGEAQLKNDAGEVVKFKLADFSEPDQKYLRDLAIYRRKITAGEKAELPADPAKACLEIQPRSEYPGLITQAPPVRKPLFEFPIRPWTDTAGKKIQGKLVTAYGDKVVIDVKGAMFDLPITRLSGDDQQYISIQLKGLQRDDLVGDLAKATKPAKQPNATPEPAAVAANTPATPPAGQPATPAADDIQARLAQLKSQLQSNNPTPAPSTVTNNPPAPPSETNDINARLAKLREQAGAPLSEQNPTPPAAWSGAGTGSTAREQVAANLTPSEMNPQDEEANFPSEDAVVAAAPNAKASPSNSSDSESGGGGSQKTDISIGYLMAVGAAILGGLARFFIGG